MAAVPCTTAILLACPPTAAAHGPVAPVALDYLARVSRVPTGLKAQVVDGDQRMWLRAPPSKTVVVIDYRGAPYLRFARFRVQVNQNSVMYYLNQTPFAATPPANLTPRTPAKWLQVSDGPAYEWHDGRLHALATVAIPPGVSYVGRWRIPILVDDRASSITGGLWYAAPPSLVWFWPAAVLVLCVLAAWRIRRTAIDLWTARLLGLAALGAIAASAAGRYLHGRPGVTVFQLVELGAIAAFVAWGLFRLLVQRPGFFSYLVIAVLALWGGGELIPTLLNGFVLIPVPAFVARLAAVVGLGAGVSLLPMVFRLADLRDDQPSAAEELEREEWDLA